MDYKTVTVQKGNGIATLTLNRPEKLNAVNEEMMNDLMGSMRQLRQDSDVRVVIITGAGQGFCSGGDLSMRIYQTTDATELYHFMDQLAQLITHIRAMPKPVIASVNGVAAGGGCNLALACDLIIASEGARFSEIFITKNLHPDTGGTYFLPRLVGTARAMEFMLTGRMVGAEEAARIGLVNNIVPDDQLERVTKELAMTIAKASPVVVRMIKASIYEGMTADLSNALENESRAQALIVSSGLWLEGAEASAQNEKK